MSEPAGPAPAGTGPGDPGAAEPRAEPPDALEWVGWGLLALLTAVVLLLAFLRPTDPGGFVNEIRLAAGFDRYEAAMQEGERLYALALAHRRRLEEDDVEGRAAVLEVLAEAEGRFRTARAEAEGFHEDQRAQIGIARVRHVWAEELLRAGDRPWYRRDDTGTLERAREVVDGALALPDIPGDVRNDLEELRTRIDRAITPWPVL